MALLMLLVAAGASAATFDLDPGQGALYVLVRRERDTVASALAHDHVVAATNWTGRVALDTGSCSAAVVVPVRSLLVDEPSWRARAGLSPITSRQARKVRASMLDDDQLHVSAFSEITFAADGCSAAGTTLTVVGRLTIRGVTRDVAVPLRVATADGRLGATGTFTMRATDFGFEPYSAFLGSVKNKDEMAVVVDVVGVPRAPG